MDTHSYKTIIEKDGKRYHGYAPALPGCHTDGDTVEETRRNLKEAMEGWLMSRKDLGWPIPDSDVVESVETISLPVNIPVQYA